MPHARATPRMQPSTCPPHPEWQSKPQHTGRAGCAVCTVMPGKNTDLAAAGTPEPQAQLTSRYPAHTQSKGSHIKRGKCKPAEVHQILVDRHTKNPALCLPKPHPETSFRHQETARDSKQATETRPPTRRHAMLACAMQLLNVAAAGTCPVG